MQRDNFDCEYQNDPPDELKISDQLVDDAICKKINGMLRYEQPAGVVTLTASVDVHDNYLYYAVEAYQKGAVGYVIDYGSITINSPAVGTLDDDERTKQVDLAIIEALETLDAELSKNNIRPAVGLVDSGYRPNPVYHFCGGGSGIWKPSKGGTGRHGVYKTPQRSNTILKIGNGYHISRVIDKRTLLVILNPNHWKKQVHDGIRVPEIASPGSISLYGSEPSRHRAIARHITAEAYNTDKGAFETIHRKNHWLDCLAGCRAAAEMMGVSLIQPVQTPRKVKYSDIQREKQRQRRATAS
jgi:phage terminase large subunit GpA-like protein